MLVPFPSHFGADFKVDTLNPKSNGSNKSGYLYISNVGDVAQSKVSIFT